MYLIPKVIVKAVTQSTTQITPFSDQVRMRLILQLIKGVSRVIQNLLKYLNGTAIFAFIISPLLVFSENFNLN